MARGGLRPTGPPRCLPRLPLLLLLLLAAAALLGPGGPPALPVAHAARAAPLLRDLAAPHGEALRCRACGAHVADLGDALDIAAADGFLVPPAVAGDEAAAGGATAEVAAALAAAQSASEPPLLRLRNPQGAEFRVLTVADADVRSFGTVSSEATFFDNYRWQMVRCAHCGAQLGWRYLADPERCAGHREAVSAVLNSESPASAEPSGPSAAGAARAAGRSEPNDADGIPANEMFSLDWALKSLEGICLKSTFRAAVIEWCYGDKLSVLDTAKGERGVLGTHDPSFQAKALAKLETFPPEQTLGERPRSFYPIFLKPGATCEGERRYSAQVQVMCCDSFDMSAMNADRMQTQHLRIEIVQRVTPCIFRVVVCLPKLCMVPGFAVSPRPARPPDAAAAASSANAPGRGASKAPPRTGKARGGADATRARCPAPVFYGLMWDRLLHDGAPDAAWLDSLRLGL